jgi:hypothetical protein
MRVGDVIDRSFELLRREWRAALVLGLIMVVGSIFLVFAVFAMLGLTFADFDALDPNYQPDIDEAAAIAMGLFITVVSILFGVVVYVATGIAARAAAHGPEEGTDWSGLAGHSWPALRGAARLFGWGLLFGIAVAILFGLALVPIAFGGEEAGALALLLFFGGMLAFFVGAIALAPFFMVLTAAVFVDDASVPASARKAWRLVKLAYWPSLGATVILWLFSLVPLVGSILVAVLTPTYQVALLEELEGLEA